MLILIVILSAALVAFFLAAPRSVKNSWFKRENRASTLSKVLVLVFLLSLLLIYGYSGSAHSSIPAGASIVAFGMLACTSLASIIYLQTRPVPIEKESNSTLSSSEVEQPFT